MKVESAVTDGITRTAWFSDCGMYRYRLRHEWDASKPTLGFLLLNPSKASHLIDDATARIGRGRSQRLGYGAMEFVNTHAYRATQPNELLTVVDPEGPENLKAIFATMAAAELVVCAWGANDLVNTRRWLDALELVGDRGKLRHLGLTKDGHPRHPLRISYEVPLMEFSTQ